MTGRTLVVAGATGLIGSAAVAASLARGWRTIALVRPGRGRDLPGLVRVECDFDSLDSIRDRLSTPAPTDFLCALGTTIKIAGSQEAFARVDRDYVAAFARLGRDLGAERFALVSSVGASASSRNFYLRTKGEAEAAVRAAGYSCVEIARPSFLLGERVENRPGEGAATAVFSAVAPALVGPLSIYRPIEGARVARALLAGLERAQSGAHVRHYRDLVALAAP